MSSYSQIISLFCSIVGSFTKQMVKLAIDQLRPEFERMAGRAAEKAVDSKMMKVNNSFLYSKMV